MKKSQPISLCCLSAVSVLLLSGLMAFAREQTQQGRALKSPPIQVAQLGKIPGLLDKLPLQNHLRQIALYYNQYVAENGKSPRTLQEFTDYIKKSAGPILTSIKKKKIIVVLNVRLRADAVLAYQRQANRSGQHLVVMGDRSIRSMTTAQLKKVVKGQ